MQIHLSQLTCPLWRRGSQSAAARRQSRRPVFGVSASSRRARAFTLLELLVVLAVLGLLAALILPAVQSARETARRAECQSHFKQIGLALHSYYDAHRALPPGAISQFPSVKEAFATLVHGGGYFNPALTTPETPWLFQLFPHLEQSSVWDSFDSDVGVFGHVDLRPPFLVTGLNANAPELQLKIPVLQCPSDRCEGFDYDVNKLFGVSAAIPVVSCGRANYAANWGNTTWEQTADLDGDGVDDPGVKFLGAPFTRSRSFRWSDFRDGMDQTIVAAEVRQGVGTDVRGAYTTPLPGGSLYMSRFPPNGAQDYYQVVPENGDQLPFPAACLPESRIPCTFQPLEFLASAGARSSHAGGVFVLSAGGRVAFTGNDVDHGVWIAIHSPAEADSASF